MYSRFNARGFGLTAVLVVVLVVVVIGGMGWYVWQRQHQNTSNSNSQAGSDTTAGSTILASWTWYQNEKMGFKIAYPKTWKIGEVTPISAVNGHDGLSFTLTPSNPQDGDPVLTVSSFPAEADIKDVDADPSATKLDNFQAGDGTELTLVGTVDQPSSATKPTSAGVTVCWPRMCEPRLKDGRFLSMTLSALNNQCQPHVACFIELNTASSNYELAVDIMKTAQSL